MTYQELQDILKIRQESPMGYTPSLEDIISGIQSQYQPTIQQFTPQAQSFEYQQPSRLMSTMQQIPSYNLLPTASFGQGAQRFIQQDSFENQQGPFIEYGQQGQPAFARGAFNIADYKVKSQDEVLSEVSPQVYDYLGGNILSSSSNTSSLGGGLSSGNATGAELGQASAILGAIAAFTKDSGLYGFAKNLGLISGLASAESVADIAAILGGVALENAGVAPPVVGFLTNAIKGNKSGMANNALALASPQLAIVNNIFTAATGLFGDMPTSFGDVVTQYPFGEDVFGDVGIIDATQGAKVLNSPKAADALGALMAIVGSKTGSDVSSLPTGAATTAANAISVAENIDALDALLNLTDAYGTKENVISPVVPEEPIITTPIIEPPVIETPVDISLPAYVSPVMPDFSVDTNAILNDLQNQSTWASDYLANQNAGLSNAFDTLINALQKEQEAELAIGGVTAPSTSGGGWSDFQPEIPVYVPPSYSPLAPAFEMPTYTPIVYDYTAPAVLPSYVSPTYTPS